MTTTRRTVLGAVALTPFLTAASTSASTADGFDSLPKGLLPGGELDNLVAGMAQRDEFCGTLLLTRKGRPVLTRAYGMADKASGVPNEPATIFALASVTKLLTAVAVGQLVQRGLIGYHMKIGAFVDGFPADVADRVSIHHLLTHSSGMGDHHMAAGFWEAAATWTSAAQVMDGTMEFIRRAPLAFPPGAAMRYSNSGYHVLGTIVARASGMSYHDYVRENIFRPAGMATSGFYTRPQRLADPRIARPYQRLATGERVDILNSKLFVGTPAGDSCSSVSDLDRFGRALLGGKLLAPGQTKLLLAPKNPLEQQGPGPGPGQPPGPAPEGPIAPPFQSYGPIVALQQDRWVIGLSGGSEGASTSIELYPDSGWVVTVLSNYDERTVQPIALTARRLILTAAS